MYDKEELNNMKVIITYKSAMELNTLLFASNRPKIRHSLACQDQVVSMYVKLLA